MNKLVKKMADSIRYYAFGLYDRLDRHHAFLMSGGLAFALFACAVPFALVVLAILGSIFAKPEVSAEIYALIDRIVPYPDQAASIKDVLANSIGQMSSVSEVIGIVGFLGLLLSATGLFSSLRTILNTVFRTEHVESVLLGKLWDFVLVFLILVITVIFMIAMPAWEALLELADEVNWLNQFRISGLDKVIFNVLSFSSLILVFCAIFWLVPVRKPNWRSVLVGAVTSSFLWLTAKELFGYYISHAATLKHLYGVYAFVVIAAFWIYYSALILIIGAETGQLYGEKHGGWSHSGGSHET